MAGQPRSRTCASWGHGPEQGKSSLWGQGGNGGCLPPPGRGAPSWPLLPLKSQAVFSSECSVGQRTDKSQIKEGMEKQEEVVGSGLRKTSRNKTLAASHPEEGAQCRQQEAARTAAGRRTVAGGTARTRWHLPYLEQQLEPRDALEGQDQEGLEGEALAHGVALQLLQHLAEAAVGAPVWG